MFIVAQCACATLNTKQHAYDIECNDTLLMGSPRPIEFEYVRCINDSKGHVHNIHSHDVYDVCYDCNMGVPEYVMHHLTSDEAINSERADNRTDDFRMCPVVTNIEGSISAMNGDYRKSGYDKGHMCPNNDRDYNAKSASQTFMMCNMAPQLHVVNAGLWKKTEELGHKYAEKYGEVVIVSGPIFYKDKPIVKLKDRVSVPHAFFKVFYANDACIDGYIIPNDKSEIKGRKGLNPFKADVSTIEACTNVDLR